MPASTRYSRASSPSRSTAYTSSSQQSRINIVQRLAVDFKAEKNAEGQADGASVKMFLRISIPANACIPGATIPLFAEENLKILESYIHPLDQNNVPYNFTDDMLRRTARALSLPAPSNENYLSLFDGVRSTSSPLLSSSDKKKQLESKYVGSIGISQYQVCYVLPREFPPSTRSYDGSYGRRSIAHGLQFMAALEIWAPMVVTPPHYPYTVNVPVPRCLNNYLSLKVFPPPNHLSSSAASLASNPNEEWDINCNPPLRTSEHKRSLSRSTGSSYQHFADDESSDSSGSGYDWTRIKGTFLTTDALVIRWALPPVESPQTSDERRRVGWKEVKGEMTCAVLDDGSGKGKSRGRSGASDDDEGVVMQLEYTGTCKGVVHSTSAWLLAFDVQLSAGDCEVTWAPGEKQQWTVSGGKCFTGWWVGPPPKQTPAPSRRPSMSSEAPSIRVQPSTPKAKANSGKKEEQRWSSSSSSLLRAPLPSLDDSLSESSPNIEPTPLSSLNSSAVTTVPSSPEKRSRASSVAHEEEEPRIFSPKVPISIHVDTGRMIPPQTGSFTFTISGSVLVKPPEKSFHLRRSFTGSDDSDSDPITLPQFRVVYTEKQMVSSIVRNDMASAALDIYNITGSLSDPQTRKTVVQPRGQTKLGNDGARLAVHAITSPDIRPYSSMRDRSVDIAGRRTPNGLFSRPSSAMSTRSTPRRRTRTDGKTEIAHAVATVTPEFASEHDAVPTEYEVRLVADVDADPDGDTEWFAFGLPRPVHTAGETKDVELPKVNITKVTLDGIAVHYETSMVEKPGEKLPVLGFPLGDEAPKDSMTWVQVHLGEAEGGKILVEYCVSMPERLGEKGQKGKAKKMDAALLDVLLPTFELPVGKMEVRVPEAKGFSITPTRSNFTSRQQFSEGSVLIRRNVEELFHPELTITIAPLPLPGQTKSGSPAGWWTILAVVICTIPTTISLLTMSENRLLIAERSEMKQALDALSASLAAFPTETPLPLTVTSTHLSVSTVTVAPLPTTQAHIERAADPVPSSSTSTSKPEPLSSIPTLTPTVISSSTPSASPTDAILPIHDMPFLWPIHFDIPPLDIPETARATAAVLVRGLGFAWQLCRKVFHYPLDPP